jgi:hypothetical protein
LISDSSQVAFNACRDAGLIFGQAGLGSSAHMFNSLLQVAGIGAAVFVTVCSFAQTARPARTPADQPLARRDQNSQIAHDRAALDSFGAGGATGSFMGES